MTTKFGLSAAKATFAPEWTASAAKVQKLIKITRIMLSSPCGYSNFELILSVHESNTSCPLTHSIP
jgi:hypothetical protein